MKLRLSPNKTTVRITDEEWLGLQSTGNLNQNFWLSGTKKLIVNLYLVDTAAFISTNEGFNLFIDRAEFQQQKTKKDQAWDFTVNSHFSISVEIDIIKASKSIKDVVTGV